MHVPRGSMYMVCVQTILHYDHPDADSRPRLVVPTSLMFLAFRENAIGHLAPSRPPASRADTEGVISRITRGSCSLMEPGSTEASPSPLSSKQPLISITTHVISVICVALGRHRGRPGPARSARAEGEHRADDMYQEELIWRTQTPCLTTHSRADACWQQAQIAPSLSTPSWGFCLALLNLDFTCSSSLV